MSLQLQQRLPPVPVLNLSAIRSLVLSKPQPVVSSGDNPCITNSLFVSRSSWSLHLVCLARFSLTQSVVRLWLPTSTCNETLYYLDSPFIDITFYSDHFDTDDFSSLHTLNQLISPVDIFVHTHYFGSYTPIQKEVKDYLCQRGAWIVEDAAHLLQLPRSVGRHSHFVLRSLYKHIPIPTGAELLLTTNTPSSITCSHLQSLIRSKLQKRVNILSSIYFDALWLLKQFYHSQPFTIATRILLEDDPPTSFKTLPITPTLLSLLIYRRCSSILPLYQSLRLFATDYFCSILQLLSVHTPSSDGSAFLIPIDLDTRLSSSSKLKQLCLLRLPLLTWPSLSPHIYANPHLYPTSIHKRRHSAYLSTNIPSSLFLLCRLTKSILYSSTKNLSIAHHVSSTHSTLSPSFLVATPYYVSAKSLSSLDFCCFSVSHDQYGVLAQFNCRIKIFLGISFIRLNLSPILLRRLPHCSAELTTIVCIKQLITHLRSRSGPTVLTIAPNLSTSPTTDFYLKLCGLRRLPLSRPWSTGYLDLSPSLDELLRSFKGKWRNGLRKAQRSQFTTDNYLLNQINLPPLLQRYQSHQSKHSYTAIPASILRKLVLGADHENYLQHFVAYSLESQDTILSEIVLSFSSNTATYLIGMSSAEGRRHNANSLLLWQAIQFAKNKGINFFDLGGLSSSSSSDPIARFKLGLNPIVHNFSGEWISIF